MKEHASYYSRENQDARHVENYFAIIISEYYYCFQLLLLKLGHYFLKKKFFPTLLICTYNLTHLKIPLDSQVYPLMHSCTALCIVQTSQGVTTTGSKSYRCDGTLGYVIIFKHNHATFQQPRQPFLPSCHGCQGCNHPLTSFTWSTIKKSHQNGSETVNLVLIKVATKAPPKRHQRPNAVVFVW